MPFPIGLKPMTLSLLVAMSILLQPLFVQPAIADDCLLDTNNDGNADSNVDTDNGADSANVDARVACGTNASALGAFGTAVGSESTASASEASAFGNNAEATGTDATAIGSDALASGTDSLAVGEFARAEAPYAIAVGDNASVLGANSIALGGFTAAPAPGSVAVGYSADASAENSSAIGFRATAAQINSMVLGSIPGVNGASAYVDVANGTTAPLAPLHIFRDDGTAQVLVEETSLDPVPRTLFRLASAGSNAKFEIDNTLAGESWAFTNSGGDFRISRQGSGVIEFRVFNNGDAFIAGDLEVGGNLLTNVLLPSDENLKQNVEAIDPETVLEKVASLPVSAWEYTDRPGERHIGPMAQDFREAFGLGRDETSISTVDVSGVALASIQALNQKLNSHNAALEDRNGELEREVSALREELDQMKAMVMQLLPQTAQN
jgi:autotransporter adhesin